MNTNRYYFPDCIADDTLSILAVQAKELIERYSDVVKAFEVNSKELYGDSPSKTLFLMNQNSKSIFSSSPISESSPNASRPYQGLSTPVSKNQEGLKAPRRLLPLDHAEKIEGQYANLETSSPVRHQTVIVSPGNLKKLSPTIDNSASLDEQFIHSTDSTGRHAVENQESPRSAEMTKMTANLTLADKESEGPVKMGSSIDESSQECTPSTEVTLMTTSPTMVEKESTSPANAIDKITKEKEESPKSAEITRMTSRLTVDDEISGSCITDKTAGDSGTNKDALKPEENTEKAAPSDAVSKDTFSHGNEIVKISKPTLTGRTSPSPAKITKSSAFQIAETAHSSSEDSEAAVSPISGDKRNKSPIEACKGISRDERKRKSVSPKVRRKNLFKWIPKVIQSQGKAEIDVEVPCFSEDNASPTTSQSSPLDPRSQSLKDIFGSPVAGELTTKASRKIFDWNTSPPEIRISSGNVSTTNSPGSGNVSAKTSPGSDNVFATNSPSTGTFSATNSPSTGTFSATNSPSTGNVSATNSPGTGNVSATNSPGTGNVSVSKRPGTGNVLSEKDPSDTPSTAATGTKIKSCTFEVSSADTESDSFALNHRLMRFNSLLWLRNEVMEKMFCSLLNFQKSVQFLNAYAHNAARILFEIDTSDKIYVSKELREAIFHFNAVTLKLIKRIKSWITDVEFDVNTWHKCSLQIAQLKGKFEPFTKEGKLIISFEALQVYEYEIKTIWKKMDETIVLLDSKKSLFSQMAFDFENLMKKLFKCLLLVGILLPR